jgi:hypothetical protein
MARHIREGGGHRGFRALWGVVDAYEVPGFPADTFCVEPSHQTRVDRASDPRLQAHSCR